MYFREDKFRNHKYEQRIITTHQALIKNGRIINYREIIEYINAIDFETATYFYQNLLDISFIIFMNNDELIEIINLYEVRQEVVSEPSR